MFVTNLIPSINSILRLVHFSPAQLPSSSFASFLFAVLSFRSLTRPAAHSLHSTPLNHPHSTTPPAIMRLTLLVVALLSAMMIASACPAPKDNNKGFRGEQGSQRASGPAAVHCSGPSSGQVTCSLTRSLTTHECFLRSICCPFVAGQPRRTRRCSRRPLPTSPSSRER